MATTPNITTFQFTFPCCSQLFSLGHMYRHCSESMFLLRYNQAQLLQPAGPVQPECTASSYYRNLWSWDSFLKCSLCTGFSYYFFFPPPPRVPLPQYRLWAPWLCSLGHQLHLPGKRCCLESHHLISLPLQARAWGANRSSCGAQVG